MSRWSQLAGWLKRRLTGRHTTANRRRNIRIPVSIPALLTSDGASWPALLREVSPTGLRVLSDRSLAPGATVEVSLTEFALLPSTQQPVSFLAVWTRSVGGLWRVGLAPTTEGHGWMSALVGALAPDLPKYERRRYRRFVCRFAVSLVNTQDGERVSAICINLGRQGCQVYVRRAAHLSGENWTIRLGPGQGWSGLSIPVSLGSLVPLRAQGALIGCSWKNSAPGRLKSFLSILRKSSRDVSPPFPQVDWRRLTEGPTDRSNGREKRKSPARLRAQQIPSGRPRRSRPPHRGPSLWAARNLPVHGEAPPAWVMGQRVGVENSGSLLDTQGGHAMPKLDPKTLLHPEVFPHPVTDLQLLETHISWVILTGDWAYKIKKPVDLGFLDYSSLEKRRYLCHEELRLNRRLAPQLYDQVVPLAEQQGRLRFEGGGEPLEYAVRMRQFAQQNLYSRQLEEGRLDTSKLEKLGCFLADFHRGAESSTDTDFGLPAEVQGPCLDNFTTLLEREPAYRNALGRLRSWTQRTYRDLEPVLAGRRKDGFVRELHGDLHLRNVTEVDGHPLPFDGIAFDPLLRWIDTMNDLAFLASDLVFRARPDLAQSTLNAYLEESGDYAGLQLWDYYLIYRWLVRAKVMSFSKAHGRADADECIGRYLELAEQQTQPREPYLWITHGLSGSGKTYFSQTLLGRPHLIRLRSDVIRKQQHGLTPSQSSDSGLASGLYSEGQSRLTYAALAEEARRLLELGYSVVVDATFLKRSQREAFRALAKSQKVPFQLIHLEADLATLRQRIKERTHDASEADLAVLEYQLQSYQPLDPDEGSLGPHQLLRAEQGSL